MIITIDGPAGTGKSTAARRLAQQLGIQYLDTGAMYRAVAWACIAKREDPHDALAAARVAREIQIDIDDLCVRVDGVDVSQRIRDPDVATAASIVAQIPDVRRVLVEQQRRIAMGRDIVCEGRDQGTVVFPEAEFKFFLTAASEERARRRQEDLAGRQVYVPLDELLNQQQERDERDANRNVAPLRPADDAIVIDTTGLGADAVESVLEKRIRGKTGSTTR
jgi:cytidylate kinase